MKSNFSLKSALIAGFVGTVAMTVFTYMAPLMGFSMDIPKMLSSMFGNILVVGWFMHFMVGIILAVSYGFIFYNKLSFSNSIVKGAAFAILPWLMAQLVVMPMMTSIQGMGFSTGLFSGSFLIAMASLMGHLLYGAVVGKLYKPVFQ
ncbi:MAG: hypothetical protein D4R68_06040 [Ignavibacteriales bacterium]|nr:MAG: hypothetical protein D4R68_06040 [Ignavibacteriales bacterium]